MKSRLSILFDLKEEPLRRTLKVSIHLRRLRNVHLIYECREVLVVRSNSLFRRQNFLRFPLVHNRSS